MLMAGIDVCFDRPVKENIQEGEDMRFRTRAASTRARAELFPIAHILTDRVEFLAVVLCAGSASLSEGHSRHPSKVCLRVHGAQR